MTDTTLPPGDEAGDRIEPVDIQQEMQRSYIDYAMSVIVGRALPEVRDGLKPVHRRVLYAMYDSGFRPDRSHAKSARSVAETMGNYHPHGDASIYDTLVRMAQPWSLRYPLVDGQGNFGSPGNDPPAAMRYCVPATPGALPLGQSVRIATSSRVRDQLGQRDRDEGAWTGTATRSSPIGCSIPASTRPTRCDRGGLRGHRDREPSAAVPGGRGRCADAAVEADRRGTARRPRGDAADPAGGIRSRRTGTTHGGAPLGGVHQRGLSSPRTRAGFNNLDRDYFNMVVGGLRRRRRWTALHSRDHRFRLAPARARYP